MRWLASREDLGASAGVDDADKSPPPSQPGFLRRVLAREPLLEDSGEQRAPAARAPRSGLFSWLLGREELPEDAPEAAAHSTRGLAWLLAREHLPEDTPAEEGTKRLRLLRFLATPEALPLDPPEPPSPAGRGVTLRWLLRREPLGDEQGPTTYSATDDPLISAPDISPDISSDMPLGEGADTSRQTGGPGPASR